MSAIRNQHKYILPDYIMYVYNSMWPVMYNTTSNFHRGSGENIKDNSSDPRQIFDNSLLSLPYYGRSNRCVFS